MLTVRVWLIISVTLLAVAQALAACPDATNNAAYVLSGSSGGNGSTWASSGTNAAFSGFGTGTGQANPSSLVRGCTYFVGTGSYNASTTTTFNTPDGSPSTTLITLQAPTASNHGTSTGYTSGVLGQAAFGPIIITTDYWTVNGAYRANTGQPWVDWRNQSGYGFEVSNNNGSNCPINNSFAVGIGEFNNNVVANNVTIEYVNVNGSGDTAQTCANIDWGLDVNGFTATTSNFYLGYSYIHDTAGDNVLYDGVDGGIAEYNYIDRSSEGSSTNHVENFAIRNNTDNLIFRYNFIGACGDTACLATPNASGNRSDWYIYGNIFFINSSEDPVTYSSGDGSLQSESYTSLTTAYYVNNTISSLNPIGACGMFPWPPITTSGVFVENNLWFNCPQNDNPALNSGLTWDYNAYYESPTMCANDTAAHTSCGSTNPFVNVAQTVGANNFNLTGDTTAGVTLSSSLPPGCTTGVNCFNTDMNGVTRGVSGTWDRGALQYQSSTTYTLTVSVSGSGSVSSSPSGISCPSTCSASYASGTVVTLSETPTSGYMFSGWSGACTGTGSCSVTMSSGQSVGATFSVITYSLSVSSTVYGGLVAGGTITGAGLTCPGICSVSTSGAVTLTATPSSGYYFLSWSGAAAACASNTTCPLNITANSAVTVQFYKTNPFSGPTGLSAVTWPATTPFSGVSGACNWSSLPCSAEQTWSDQAFATCSVRLTDGSFDPSNLYATMQVTNGGGVADVWWSTPLFQSATQDTRLTLVGNNSGTKYLMGAKWNSPCAWNLYRPYYSATSGCPAPTSGNCSTRNGWSIGASVFFSRYDPCRLYALATASLVEYEYGSDVVTWTNPCSTSISGPPAATTLVNYGAGNDPSGCTGTGCTGLPGDFTNPVSACSGVANYTSAITWSDTGSAGGADAGFYEAFSSANYHWDGNDWQASTAYPTSLNVGTQIQPLLNNPCHFTFVVSTAGTSGSTEPVWNTLSCYATANAICTSPDGTVTWKNRGLVGVQDTGIYVTLYSPLYGVISMNTQTGQINADPAWKGTLDWTASGTYQLQQRYFPSVHNTGANTFMVTVAGTGGSSEPNWDSSCPSAGQTCTDGTATLVNTGFACSSTQCTGSASYGGYSSASASMSGATATFSGSANFNSNFQGGAFFTASGCSVSGYNSVTWTVVTGGSNSTTMTATSTGVSGLASATGCALTVTPYYFTLHAGKMSTAGTWAEVSHEYCINAPSAACPTGALAWVTGTTTLFAELPVNSGGHSATGQIGVVNDGSSSTAGYSYRSIGLSNPPGAGVQANVGTFPTCSGTPGVDQHEGWDSASPSDTNAFPFAYTNYSGTATSGLLPFDQPTCPWTGELDYAINNGSGLSYREALSYNSQFSSVFDVQNDLFVSSIDNLFASMGSDGYQALRSGNGTTSCIPSGPDWATGKAYVSGYYISPSVNNAAGDTFKIQTPGTAGGSEPNWGVTCPSVSNTCTDGTAVWVNLGAPTTATGCASDVIAWHIATYVSAVLPRRLNALYLANTPLPIGTNNTHYLAVLAQHNVRLTGQTVDCGGGTNGSTPCYFDSETATGVACSPTISFTIFDSIVADYTLTNLLLAGVTEGGTNQYAPECVFSQAQANASALSWVASTGYLASDYILASGNYWQSQTICSNSTYDSTCVSGTSLPTCFASSTSPCADGQINWIKLGANAPLLDVFCGPNYKCGPSGSSCYDVTGTAVVFNSGSIPTGCTTTQLYEGEIITSELPFRNWFINSIIPAVIAHYGTMSGFGYLRVGCTAGGECNPIGIGSGLYPFYQSTPGCITTPCATQQRATYLSYVKILDTAIEALQPQMIMFHDLTCPGGDCLYADQFAALAYSLNFNGISTNALDVNDVQNVLGTGSTPCAIPPVADSGCTTGDFFYNFYTYSTNAAGAPLWHGLQTATGSTPLDCLPGITGPLFAQPGGLADCPSGFIGLLPFLTYLQFVGTGSPNTKIYVNNLELYVNPPTSGTSPTVAAGDVLLALDPNYLTTTGAQSTYFPYQAAQAAAFYRWLFPFNPPASRNFVVADNRVLDGILDWPTIEAELDISWFAWTTEQSEVKAVRH
jgi:Divergent InlB B-repeat domain